MVKIYLKQILVCSLIFLSSTFAYAQQVPNPSFEDWSGEKYNDEIQLKDWYASNVTQVGFKFNLAHREAGHTGNYSMMVQDTEVGAMGITEVSPGYFSLGKPWTHLPSITEINKATAGTSGGINFKYRPDTMSVWIKRTGPATHAEDFYLLYYAWSGTAKGSKYKGKDGNCTGISQTNEESDIRLALDANECGTDQKANQIAEGMWRERKEYGTWTNIRVPIYYFSNDVPTMMNIIFSASNYPNYRANDGLYKGNSLYVDDVELIYSSKIQKLYIGGKEWKGFDPTSSEEQTYSLGRSATTIPEIKAYRGAGSITNARGESATFNGRELTGSEISMMSGTIDGAPVEITVNSEDGKSSSIYKIKFVREASKNAKLANIHVNGNPISGFKPDMIAYNYQLPYGTTATPKVTVEQQEDEQTVEITQATSTTGTATIKVTAADKKTTMTYTVSFSVALLADNTLKDIKVNGVSIPGFTPNQTIYRVSLPTTTTTVPKVEAISAYPAGEQTITHSAPSSATNLDGSQHVISVTTPGNQVPKTYKLTYRLEASSYSLLKNLQMIDKTGYNWIQKFSPDQFTYYVNLPIGTTELPSITYEKGEASQTVSIKEGGLNGVTEVTVVAGDGTQSKYKIVVSTAKSNISTLKMIYLNGQPLEGFNANKTSYSHSLPIGTTALPKITVDKGDEYQTVSVRDEGINGTARITVSAQDGSTTIYQIAFSVAKATNASLKMIYLDGKPLEGFDPNILEYHCPLPQGTTKLPVISYDKGDEYQTITTRDGGINGDYKITVRPQSGSSQTYTLHFSVATSDNANLSMIYLDRKPLKGFNAQTFNYIDTLPMGITTIPEVTFDKADDTQKVLSIRNNNVHTIKVTAESGNTQTYTITFIIQRSNSAFLQMIYLDGKSLEGFDKNIFDYTISLTQATCPKITVDKEEGQQVTITAPYSTGKAKIVVTPESGASNTYTINFVNVSSNYALLHNIYVDGQAIADFSPEQFVYSVACNTYHPEITYDSESTQQVTIFRQKDKVTLYVVSGNSKAQYEITLNPKANTNCTLRNILVNGVSIDGFASTVYNYTLSVENALPTITYEKQYAEQVVYAGMLNTNTYSLLVAAQSGDTARYTLHLEKQLSNDANLINLQLQGMDGAITFVPTTYEYIVSLPEGYALPNILVETKTGQDVAMHSASNTEQQVIVTAEDGTTNTYRIIYDRKKSANAWLSDILIDGTSLDGFDAEVYEYTDTLAWRTKVVPCVQPIGSHKDQVITTYHSAIDGTTTITVLAPDGVTTKTYAIHFPVIKSSNTALGGLDVNEAIDYTFNPNTTSYHILLPYGTTAVPTIFYDKAEPEQEIEYIAAPLDGITKFIVTAENGEQRTYSLTFSVQQSALPNVLKSITVNDYPLDLTHGNNIEVNLPYGSTEFNVAYEKNFAEQTVSVVHGDMIHPTKLVVYSNRPSETPITYTIIPKLTHYTPAVLNSITIDGTPIANFQPDQYTYIVNVESLPEINYTADESIIVEQTESDAKHVTLTVTKDEYTSIYNIYFYYQNDVIPGKNLTDFVSTKYNGKVKPKGWMVPADCAESYTWTFLKVTTGQEVTPLSNSGVHLSTWRDGDANAIYGSIPGIMTIGTLQLSLKSTGNSTSSVSGGITFRNTPDQIATEYRATAASNMNNWRLWVNLSDGSNTVQTLHEEPYGSLNEWKSVVKELDYSGLGLIQQMNLTVNSAHSDNAEDLGGTTKRTSELDIRNLRFIYNSKIATATIDGNEATINGTTITYHIDDPEYNQFPTLQIVGEKQDQMPIVTWEDEEEGVRKALIHNVAEDGSYTDYTLVITRALSTEKRLQYLTVDGIVLSNFNADTYSYVDTLPNGYTTLPSIAVTPMSAHQEIDIQYLEQSAIITVTPESGDAQQYTIQFVEEQSNSTQLASITANGITFDADTREYHIEGDKLPTIEFTKLSDGQTVTLSNGVLTVLAEDGITTGQYAIILDKPTTTAQLSDIEVDGVSLQEFDKDKYEYTLTRPITAAFKRAYESDSVVFVQDPHYMEWQVIGDERHTYRITYPTELSSNTYLKAFYIDSTLYEDFDPQIYDYTYRTDKPVHIHAVANEKAKELRLEYIQKVDSSIYTYTVVAEDGTVGSPYSLTVVPNLSNMPYLQSILLDGKPLVGFRADSLHYTIVLPAGSFKAIEPTLPTIEYMLGTARQQVNIEHGALGETTAIVVTSEDGHQQSIYQLHFEAEPSHCVMLSDIAVNGVPIENFESARHYYSVKTTDDEVLLTWASQDNFQTVTQSSNGNIHTLHVVAQDGISSSEYEIEIYKENASSDVTLRDILLDGQTFDQFQTAINDELIFSPMQQRYNINLPSGSLYLPEVSALLNSEGQDVQIVQTAQTIEIHVTAPDKVSKNTYTLRFYVPQSSNAHLQMIYLGTDSLDGFAPDRYNYFIDLPIGQTDMPEIYPIPQESTQTIQDSITGPLQHTIYVTAEDGTIQQYLLAFQRTYSDADTLLALYADGVMIEGFQPDSFYYAYTLPVGTDHIPELSWQEADEWQTVTTNTILNTSTKHIKQINVLAGSGRKNTYTVSYEILQSAVDTLRMIYLGADSLDGFDPLTTDYYIYLAPDSIVPNITWDKGDLYQEVSAEQLPYTINGTQIGWKTILSVLAQNGQARSYTIYLLFTRALSTNTQLEMIYLNGQAMSDFNPEQYNYRITVPLGEQRPSVLVTAAEPEQTVHIAQGDTTLITVTAEDKTTTDTYILIFNYQQSPYAYLAGIYQDEVLIDGFRADSMEYHIVLPYGTTTLPHFTYEYGIEGQTVEIDTITSTNIHGQSITCYSFIVTAPDEETSVQYDLYVMVALNDDCSLKTLLINGIQIQNFHPDTTAYQVIYPIGSDSTILVTQEAITATATDPNATIMISSDGYNFNITVTSHDGMHTRIYTIEQIIMLSSNTRLAALYIDGILLRDFDPEVIEYTYYIGDVLPYVDAIPEDSTATIVKGIYTAEQPYNIYVTAQDGTEQIYTIYFIATTIQSSSTPTVNDVLVKYLGDMTFGVATLRKNVSIAVYTAEGHQLFLSNIDETSQNDAVIGTNAEGKDCLMDVHTTSTQFTLPETNQMFFYVFLENGTRRITSGKLIVTP